MRTPVSTRTIAVSRARSELTVEFEGARMNTRMIAIAALVIVVIVVLILVLR